MWQKCYRSLKSSLILSKLIVNLPMSCGCFVGPQMNPLSIGTRVEDPLRAASSPQGLTGLFKFFKALGQAKHEPCGEHWNVTFGESAWRLAIMAMCVSPKLDRKRLIQCALTSAFTR